MSLSRGHAVVGRGRGQGQGQTFGGRGRGGRGRGRALRGGSRGGRAAKVTKQLT